MLTSLLAGFHRTFFTSTFFKFRTKILYQKNNRLILLKKKFVRFKPLRKSVKRTYTDVKSVKLSPVKLLILKNTFLRIKNFTKMVF